MNKLTVVIGILFLTACSSEKSKKTALQLQPASSNKIIGGSPVMATNPIKPFVVGLYDRKTRFVCTGSLIRKNLVLTAAHCIESSASHFLVIFGSNFSSLDNNDSKFLRQATQVKVHPDFKGNDSTDLDWNDLALLQFSGEAPEGYFPISFLSESALLKPGTSVQMAGFGASGVELEEVNNRDRKFDRDVANGDVVCSDPYQSACFRVEFLGSDELRSTETQIEGFTEKEIRISQSKGKGTCIGDSGGPLLYQAQDHTLSLIGVTSRGSPLCDGPTAYTNALEYLNWIEQTASTME